MPERLIKRPSNGRMMSGNKSIYRIVSFFELLQTLRSRKLRVSSASRFSDPNEMIGYLFATLANPLLSPGTSEGLERAKAEIAAVRESYYVSSWTRTRDSIAMWEIYSTDHNSVQIEADEEVIRGLFGEHMNSAPWTAARGTEPNWGTTVFYPPLVRDCQYENLLPLAAKLRAKTRGSAARASTALMEEGFEAFKALWDVADKDKAHSHDALFFVKDEAYRHEQEIRFCLHAMRRNERLYTECKEDPMFSLMDTHLRVSTIRESGENIFIDFPTTAIRRVWIDGRCPTWIADLQKDMFVEFGISVDRSNAYGALLERHQFDIWWNQDLAASAITVPV